MAHQENGHRIIIQEFLFLFSHSIGKAGPQDRDVQLVPNGQGEEREEKRK